MGQPRCPKGLEISVCLQESAVIIDTSSLPLIARVAYQTVTGYSHLQSGAGNELLFVNAVADLLTRLSGCARERRLLTTTFAYDEEMNPNLPGWVFARMPYLSDIYHSDVYRPQLELALREHIQALPVNAEDVSALQRNLREEGGYDISFKDTSLILLGLNLAREGNVFLVTEDQRMLDAIQWLQSRRRIRIREQTYDTRDPHGLQLIGASRSVHGCCELDSGRYCEVFAAYHHHLRDRQRQGEISREALEAHARIMAKASAWIYADCDGKNRITEEASITAEIERHFLRDDQE